MQTNFIDDLCGTSPQECWQVSFAHSLSFASPEWIEAHREKYDLVMYWISRQLSNPDTKALYNACERINNARYQKNKRLNRFMKPAVEMRDCVFVTLTFSDDTLERTSAKTRREYVTDFLRPYICYVFNLDYGKKNEREHYHALVVGVRSIDCKPWHKYGAIKVEIVRNREAPQKMTKYMTKLTNHATKGTCTGRVTYSKVKPWELPLADWYIDSFFDELHNELQNIDCPF